MRVFACLLVLFTGVAFADNSVGDAETAANVIKIETVAGANTANRVGDALEKAIIAGTDGSQANDWVIGKDYHAGQLAVSSNILYRRISDGTSAGAFNAPDWLSLSSAAPTLSIDQDSNAIALSIDTEATTADGVFLDSPKQTTSHIIHISDADGLSTGSAIRVENTSISALERFLVDIEATGANALGCTPLRLQHVSPLAEAMEVIAAGVDVFTITGLGTTELKSTLGANVLTVDQDHATGGVAIQVDTEGTTTDGLVFVAPTQTTGHVLNINDAISLTTGSMIRAYSNSVTTNTRFLVDIHNDNTLATGAVGLNVKQDSTADGVFVDQGGDGASIVIDTEAEAANGLEFPSPGMTTGNVIDVINADSLTTGSMLSLHSNGVPTDNRNLIEVHNDNVLATGAVGISVRQDSTADIYRALDSAGAVAWAVEDAGQVRLLAGSDPTDVTDTAHVYAKDVTASAEVFVRDEATNVTQISPHDVETGEWVFNSTNEKTGRKLNIRIEALLMKLAEKYPEDFAEFINESHELSLAP